VGGNADLVEAGKTGYTVPAADPNAMAQHLVGLCSGPGHARAMGEAGRHRVLAHFSMQAMVSTYQAVYDRQMQRVRSL